MEGRRGKWKKVLPLAAAVLLLANLPSAVKAKTNPETQIGTEETDSYIRQEDLEKLLEERIEALENRKSSESGDRVWIAVALGFCTLSTGFSIWALIAVNSYKQQETDSSVGPEDLLYEMMEVRQRIEGLEGSVKKTVDERIQHIWQYLLDREDTGKVISRYVREEMERRGNVAAPVMAAARKEGFKTGMEEAVKLPIPDHKKAAGENTDPGRQKIGYVKWEQDVTGEFVLRICEESGQIAFCLYNDYAVGVDEEQSRKKKYMGGNFSEQGLFILFEVRINGINAGENEIKRDGYYQFVRTVEAAAVMTDGRGAIRVKKKGIVEMEECVIR